MAELLRQGHAVQPWYVTDSGRRSTKTELATLDRMRAAFVQMNPAAADLLKPVRKFRVEDIPANAEITAGFETLAATSHLGRQYDWLARLAKSQSTVLELSIHKDDKAHGFLESNAVEFEHGYRLSEEAPASLALFKWFTFPIFDVTKLEMQERAGAGGYSHIMEMTWFCHTPLMDGKPCGFCSPCRYTREEGLGHRVPERTRARQVEYFLVRVAHKIQSRILRQSAANSR